MPPGPTRDDPRLRAQLRDEVERLSAQTSGATTSPHGCRHSVVAPALTTHLTFRQIADHLYVRATRLKTQAISVLP
jgi:hypothetical protein